MTVDKDMKDLLNRLDGQLGLAVHRKSGTEDWWLKDSGALIGEIRKRLAEEAAEEAVVVTAAAPEEELEAVLEVPSRMEVRILALVEARKGAGVGSSGPLVLAKAQEYAAWIEDARER